MKGKQIMKKIMIIATLLGMMMYTSCKKEEVEPIKTEYCDIKCYNNYSKKWIYTKNNIFTGTAKEIEDTKTLTITLLSAQGNKNISIYNCTGNKHL